MYAPAGHMVDALEEGLRLKNQANLQFQNGNLQEALQLYERAIELIVESNGAPNDVNHILSILHTSCAECYMQTKQWHEVLQFSDAAVKYDITNFKARLRRGLAQANIGNISVATKDIAISIAEDKSLATEENIKVAQRCMRTSRAKYTWRHLRFSSSVPLQSGRPLSLRAPPPRFHLACFSHNSRLYIFGGTNGNGAMGDLWNFDLERCVWEKVTCTGQPPSPRHACSAIVYNNCVYFFGGDSMGNGEISSFAETFRVLDLSAMQWKSLEINATSLIPECRYGHTAIFYNNCMYIFGGVIKGKETDQLLEYNYETRQWRYVTENTGPPPRSNHASWVYNNKLYIWGGSYEDFSNVPTVVEYNDLHVFDFATGVWEEIKQLGDIPSKRAEAGAMIFTNKILLYGGYAGTGNNSQCTNCIYYDDMHELDLDCFVWSKLDSSEITGDYVPRLAGYGTCNINGRMLWVGGYGFSSDFNRTASSFAWFTPKAYNIVMELETQLPQHHDTVPSLQLDLTPFTNTNQQIQLELQHLEQKVQEKEILEHEDNNNININIQHNHNHILNANSASLMAERHAINMQSAQPYDSAAIENNFINSNEHANSLQGNVPLLSMNDGAPTIHC